jgi:hypothetical protein
MYSGSILVGAVFLTFMIPSLVSAAEVTPQSRPNGSPVATTGTSWLGFAVSPNRRVFKSEPQQGEISARNIAKRECETTTLRTCSVIAVPDSSDVDVSAVGCTYNGRSESFLGASVQSKQTQIALGKAKDKNFPESTCVEFYTQ